MGWGLDTLTCMSSSGYREMKCAACGWVHAAIPEHVARAEGGDYSRFLRCYRCGADTAQFVPAVDSDAPLGCTLQPCVVAARFARCASCHWPAYVVSADSARAQVASINAHAERLGEERRASLDSYLRCFKCGASSAHFVETILTEREHGLTIQPCITPWSVRDENAEGA